jgi:putative nucleotidyltransferase with HDIG domain
MSRVAVSQLEKPRVVARLHPVPGVAVRLMSLVSSDDVVFRRVAELIRCDPAFSAEVLKLANSPLLGCRQNVYSILHGVALLGLERLKSLVMMVALRNFLSSALQVPVLLRCWRHSLACALLSEDLGAASWMNKDQCYTAGLLHDIGRLSLLATFPEEYAGILERVDETDGNLLEWERESFDADHCEVGMWVVREWGLPPEFQEIAGRHHANRSARRFDIVEAVRLACRLADTLGFQVAGTAPLAPLDNVLIGLPEEARKKLGAEDHMFNRLVERINALECSLA